MFQANADAEAGETTVTSDQTVLPKVEFRDRSFTDKWWALAYVLSYIAFLSCGFVLTSKAQNRYVYGDSGERLKLSDYYLADAQACCADGDTGSFCSYVNDGGRRLKSGNSTFDGDEGIFDAFIEAPEIIVGLAALTLAIAFTWIVALRFFAKPIVFLVELCKVAIFIVAGIYQEDTTSRVICFLIAVAILAYTYWKREKIIFAAKIISHSTIAMKENPSMFLAGLVLKLLYAGNAVLFVMFYTGAFNVVEVQKVVTYYGGNPSCEFVSPRYARDMSVFLCISYLWTILLFEKMRLSFVAGIVGAWHFHPEDKPSVLVGFKNMGTSFGTLSVSALIASIAEFINKLLNQNSASIWCSPLACAALPIHILMCCFGACFKTLVQMLTKYAVILHVFTGKPFVGSAKSVFAIMSRHFEGGFITEYTSKSVLTLGAYAFSLAISMVSWKWVDDEFDCGTLSKDNDQFLFIISIIFILFNVWYPVLGIYLIILINQLLQNSGKEAMKEGEDGFNHYWIPPLAACFIGSISMLMFQFLSAIFLDTIDTMFLCFAIDKDNNVINPDDEFASIVKEVPAYIDTDSDASKPDSDIPVAEPYDLGDDKK